MSEEIKQVAEVILGLLFGGTVVLIIAPTLNEVSHINLTSIGLMYIFAGLVVAILFVYGLINSLAR